MTLLLRTRGHTFRMQQVALDDSGLYEMRTSNSHPPPARECVYLTTDGCLLLLDGVGYYEECPCDCDDSQGPRPITIHMLKAALRFAAAAFPDLESVHVSDETFLPTADRPLVTAQRLLLGMPGWYQEHLGAVPTPSTLLRLRVLRAVLRAHPDIVDELNAMRPGQFTPAYVVSVCRRLQVPTRTVVGTDWNIPLETVMSWEMPTVENDDDKTSIPWPSVQCPKSFTQS